MILFNDLKTHYDLGFITNSPLIPGLHIDSESTWLAQRDGHGRIKENSRILIKLHG
jgi:hypothetical protein